MTYYLSVSPPPSTGLKWFGIFPNLSFRRSSLSDKSNSKSSSSEPDGALDMVSSPIAAETFVDDMDMMHPCTSSYARSSDNYTHMGTLPRFLLRKRDKSGSSGKRGTKKIKEKTGAGLSRSQSQRPAGDNVCSSPLLMALSSQPGSRKDQPLSTLSSQAGPGPRPQRDQGLPPITRGGSLDRNEHGDPQAHLEEEEPHQGQLTSAQDVESSTSNAPPLMCEDVSKEHTFTTDQGASSDTASTGGARRNRPTVPGQSDSVSNC
ncbi:unnamed protein product [Coregonus sp. 'balchen']|nr:unnamed protein product [Coregonus sp. 'balchen']